jgi:hypothetical protein
MTTLRCYEAQRKLDEVRQMCVSSNCGYGFTTRIEEVQVMLDEAIRLGLRRARRRVRR